MKSKNLIVTTIVVLAFFSGQFLDAEKECGYSIYLDQSSKSKKMVPKK